jgi:hypothetical protein
MSKENRKSSGGATVAKEKNQTTKVAFEKANNNTRRATGSGAKPFWYLTHRGDLAAVTNEASNDSLGIRKIDIFQPTEKQAAAGILCKVRVNTYAATIDNISIFESDFNAGDIYLQMGSGRNIGTEDAPRWTRDCKLTAQAKAQVLSYVHSLLVPAEEKQDVSGN